MFLFFFLATFSLNTKTFFDHLFFFESTSLHYSNNIRFWADQYNKKEVSEPQLFLLSKDVLQARGTLEPHGDSKAPKETIEV